MHTLRLLLICAVAVSLIACGDEPPPPQVVPAVPINSQVQNAEIQTASDDYSTGGVTAQILPAEPTSTGCLSVVMQGVPGRSAITWAVNDLALPGKVGAELCSDSYRRGDRVTAFIGTRDQGASVTVLINNSPPRVVNITATPDKVFAGQTITVEPQAEDADNDNLRFRYQWLINGYAEPVLLDPFLPGERVVKGDRLQLQIIPNDGYVDGPTYLSYEMSVPNAPPSIVSQPPDSITSLDYRYQVVAADPDDSSFTYRLAEAPAGMRIDAQSGLIEWSLSGVAPGEYTIAIVVADPAGLEGAQEYRLTLSK